MGRVWGYGRGSTQEQVDTLELQRERIEQEFEMRYQRQGHTWGGYFADSGVSGQVPIVNRPAGGRLLAGLARGDIVIVTKLDRAFRSAINCLEMLERWQKEEVRLVLLDLGMDTGTYTGRAFLAMLAVFAQMERERIAERGAEYRAYRKKHHRPLGQTPYGFLVEGKPGDRYFVPDYEMRAFGARIVEWIDGGSSYDEVYWHLIRQKVKNRKRNTWSRSCLHRIYRSEKRLQVFEAEAKAKAQLEQKENQP